VPNGTATFTGDTPTSVFITSNTIEFTTGAARISLPPIFK